MKAVLVNSGMVSVDNVCALALEQVKQPDGIMSVFAGGVYWESEDQFSGNCKSAGEHALGRLLEVRAYSGDCEFHAIRDSIDASCELSWRTVRDADYAGYLDDVQYLDIDAQRSSPEACQYRATGGGEYTLPLPNAERVRLRNYIDYDEDGVAYFADFRIVGLLGEGE